MNNNAITAIIVFGVAGIAFVLIKPSFRWGKNKGNSKDVAKRDQITKPVLPDDAKVNEDVVTAVEILTQYIDAWNNNESIAELQELSDSFEKEFGMGVHWNGPDLLVKNAEGNIILKKETAK